jgi:hypothetical protein
MKALFFEFLLYVYVNFIVEDWDTCTKLGKIYYYPFWFIRSVIVWLICPIFIIPFFVQRTETWKEFIKSMEEYKKSLESE